MKRIKLIHITIIGTLFFTACSQNEPKIKDIPKKSKVSIYNLMGITPKSKEIFIESNNEPIEQSISDDVEFISYKQEKTPINDIEYISYKKDFTNDFNQNREIINKLEWNAKQFLGVPYVWGATGPNKFDCSGFTQWVYRDIGIDIPRVSRDQARVGEYVNYTNLQRGDMVFFSTDKKRIGVVTHVGIYLGNGDFIHASSVGKKVVIYNFNNKEYYKKHFLWGRRLIKSKQMYALN